MRKPARNVSGNVSWLEMTGVLLYLLFVFFFAALISAIAYYIFTSFQKNYLCDKSSFLCEAGPIGFMLPLVSWFFLGAFPGFILANYIASAISGVFKCRFIITDTGNFKNSQRALFNIAIFFLLPVTAFISAIAFSSYFYVTPLEIVSRTSLWNHTRHYSWSDVRGITTQCSQSLHARQYNFNYSFDLKMADGNVILLIVNPLEGKNAFVASYGKISEALRGKSYFFASSIDNSCPKNLIQFLANRPE